MKQVQIVLRSDVEKLGRAGDVVLVKSGYARNYLIPAGLALLATPGNLKRVEEEHKRHQLRIQREIKTVEALAQAINSAEVTAHLSVGEEERVFGAVTASDIAELLKQKGIDIDRRWIVLEEPIKGLGTYTVPVRLQHGVQANLRVNVVKKEE